MIEDPVIKSWAIAAQSTQVVRYYVPAENMRRIFRYIEVLQAERDRLRGACEGAVNWLDALLHQVQATSCDPDDPEAFEEVLMGAGIWLGDARAALKGETP